ncbi:ATP-binding protein [Rubellimicrobium arenae]|uniref:ATP-binding protein n=1 Tax=Rubellimicrobium arenae TaxID=2817372 RepID=UPI001FEDDB96|nr:ATP-binding protein [Rubellimicrobium arenae]
MSMRLRLFLILVLATGTVWASAVLWTRARTEAHVERVLDARLSEAARMVVSLIDSHGIDLGATAGSVDTSGVDSVFVPAADYEHRLSCQIWSVEDILLGQSEGAPDGRLSSSPSGFSTSEVDGQAWRVYTAEDPDLGIRVMVADTMAMRENLVGSIITALVLPAGLVLPALLGLIWISLGRGLAPLDRVARILAARSASDLTPLPDEPAAREVRPLIEGLNGLMTRVASARESERTFTAFAAHELKTPLSGLKTQAQVAALAQDPAVQAKALAQIQRAVDRTDRMVRQLLDMAAVEAEGPGGEEPGAGVGLMLTGLVEDLAPLAQQKGVGLRTARNPTGPLVCRSPLLLGIAVRNLLENAVAASPPGGVVTLTIDRLDQGRRGLIQVRDQGPGIPADELAQVTRRFVRGRQAKGTGSGLGLAIVDLATQRLGGRLALGPAEGGGMIAEIEFPCVPQDLGTSAGAPTPSPA